MRTKDSSPCLSATTLKTRPQNGSLKSGLRFSSLSGLRGLTPATGGRSSGLGRYLLPLEVGAGHQVLFVVPRQHVEQALAPPLHLGLHLVGDRHGPEALAVSGGVVEEGPHLQQVDD